MTRKILVSLVGGRPIPNIQFILNQNPDLIYIIASKDSASTGGSIEKLINALPTTLKPPKENCIVVPPYNMQATIDACLAIFKKNAADTILINLASETKIMALAAYKAYLENIKQYPLLKIFNSTGAGIIDIANTQSDPISTKIGLEAYFKAYGWDINLQKTVSHDSIIEILLKDIKLSHSLLFYMRQKLSNIKGNGTKVLILENLTEPQEKLLKNLATTQELQVIIEKKQTTITMNHQVAEFLKGAWLECAIFYEAQKLGKFDECAWNVSCKNKTGELDFVGILNGQLVIASCKTEDGLKKGYFQEIVARAEQLGKGMCTKMLITSSSPPTEQTKIWAREYQVIVVTADDFPKLSEKLEEAINDKNRI